MLVIFYWTGYSKNKLYTLKKKPLSFLKYIRVCIFKGKLGVSKQVKFFLIFLCPRSNAAGVCAKIVPSYVWGRDYLDLLKQT